MQTTTLTDGTRTTTGLYIEPIYDGNGTSVEYYKVVDCYGTIWFQGSLSECEKYLLKT